MWHIIIWDVWLAWLNNVLKTINPCIAILNSANCAFFKRIFSEISIYLPPHILETKMKTKLINCLYYQRIKAILNIRITGRMQKMFWDKYSTGSETMRTDLCDPPKQWSPGSRTFFVVSEPVYELYLSLLLRSCILERCFDAHNRDIWNFLYNVTNENSLIWSSFVCLTTFLYYTNQQNIL